MARILEALPDDVVAELQREADAFVAPDILVGDEVLWYANAQRTGTPFVAKVLKVAGSLIEVVCYGGQFDFRPNVRHITDPTFRVRPHWREHGAWDYTDGARRQFAADKAMDERLARMERRLTELEAKSNTKKT